MWWSRRSSPGIVEKETRQVAVFHERCEEERQEAVEGLGYMLASRGSISKEHLAISNASSANGLAPSLPMAHSPQPPASASISLAVDATRYRTRVI